MKKLISFVISQLHSSAFQLTMFIVGMAIVARLVPREWAPFVRTLNGFIILSILCWLLVQARIYRKELHEHRRAIMQMLDRSTRELEDMRRVAADLAAKVAEENRRTAKLTREQISELRAEVVASTEASRSAEYAANHVNEKIEDLKTSETQQLDTIRQTTQESHKKLETIQATTAQSHEILKESKKP